MKTERITEYNNHGCRFVGNLILVSYYEDMTKDPKWGSFNANLTFDYYDKAISLIKKEYGDKIQVMLSIPECVVKIIK